MSVSIAKCGDGNADVGEQCGEPGLRCPLGQLCGRTSCLCSGGGACGNGVADRGEECGEPGLQCPLSQLCGKRTCLCSGGGLCGNGVADPGEQCRDGNLVCGSGEKCNALSCVCYEERDPEFQECGNGVLERGEECEDGGVTGGDGCSAQCRLEDARKVVRCGDGIITAGEECDDRNVRGGDGCNEECQLEEGRCGDGAVQKLLGEQCEVALHDSALPYGCDGRTCRFVLRLCGDGKRDPGEECDEGTGNSDLPNRTCRQDCSVPRCGDGVLDSRELCDDGNGRSGDGCDAYCREERLAAQATTPGVLGELVDVPVGTFNPILAQGGNVVTPLSPLAARISQSHAPAGDTGPGVIVVMAAGAAAGVGWMRRRRKR